MKVLEEMGDLLAISFFGGERVALEEKGRCW